MDKTDALILALKPEIDAKCAQIRQRKNENLLSKVFVTALLLMLTIPTLLVLLGFGFMTILVPILLIGAVMLAAVPVLISKGDVCCE